MNKIIYRSEDRGYADHGWLKTYHSFSFANYFDPDRISFGKLRVLNDDTVDAGRGFGMHPHENMEIITIPLSGTLEHKDSMGNTGIIRSGEIQVMSAGKGIYHSEYNHSKNEEVSLLQIWVIPNKVDVEPRYDQIYWDNTDILNKLYELVSPSGSDKSSWIHQDAWFYIGEFNEGKSINYSLNQDKNGVYIFLIEGIADVNGSRLNRRDAIGLTETDQLDITSIKESRILLIETPMT